MDQIQNTQTSLQPLGMCNPPSFDANVDYVISDYMERLGTRLNILETELKYAWRALDLLSQEYIKMWERLEKLEGLLYEQQSVISQLLDFYTHGGADCPVGPAITEELQSSIDNRLGQLEVIREILGNGTVEDGLEEGIDVTRSSTTANNMIQQLELEMSMDEMRPDEAFYRSLNRAYRDDLVRDDEPPRSSSQLGMIWEEAEDEREDSNGKIVKEDEIKELEAAAMSEETQEVFSALDYKDYRGDSPCVNDQDIAQLSRISSIDHLAIDKLHEIDRLTSKLQQDSRNIKELQNRLEDNNSDIEAKTLADDTSVIDEQLRQIYTDSDNWSFSSGARGIDELMLLSNMNIPTSLSNSNLSKRSNSRLSITDSVAGTDLEVAETLAGGFRTPTSPRRRHLETATCSAPYTTVTGRLAYSAAVMNAEVNASNAAKMHTSSQDISFTKYPNNSELNQLMAASYNTVQCASPVIYSVTAEKPQSPTPSMCSVRTRQDGYIGSSTTQLSVLNDEQKTSSPSQSPSPPPPAPQDHSNATDGFLMPETNNSQRNPSPVFLGASATVPTQSINTQEPSQHGRLSPRTPHSPKSPRSSPKRKDHHHNSSNIVAAKSDSGLSSMSGWSSLEKSPGSPKNGGINHKIHQQQLMYNAELLPTKNQLHHGRSSPMPPQQIQPTPLFPSDKPFTESDTDSYIRGPLQVPVCNSILPGGHHMSAFTTVKSPCSLQSSEGYGTFVPAPAPASDINVSPRRRKHHHENKSRDSYTYTYEQPPAIYSVAGSNRQEAYTSVYTSNSADYIPQTINYPDLLEPYGNNEAHNAPVSPRYPPEPEYLANTSTQPDASGKKPANRTYSAPVSIPDGVANHEGYKTAMYRTMFPSGNITDALSYYPTSQRYDAAVNNLPRADYNDPATWLNCPPNDGQRIPQAEYQEKNCPPGTVIDPRKYHQQEMQRQYPQEPVYQNQEQIRLQQMQMAQSYQQGNNTQRLQEDQNSRTWNQRQDIPYLELDLRNRNVPEYIIQQQHQQRNDGFYDPSGVIVSQSGYLSISSDLKDGRQDPKAGKKFKRSSTLKSAMNSVSHWLPDLHLPRRHRSNSLPSGVRREDLEDPSRNPTVQRGRMSMGAMHRKKKKNALVSTVSGILQKAKRRGFHSQPSSSSQSLSDPEHSENEWVSGRVSASLSEDDRSERDSDSVFSDVQPENLFAKVASSRPKNRKGQDMNYQRYEQTPPQLPPPPQNMQMVSPQQYQNQQQYHQQQLLQQQQQSLQQQQNLQQQQQLNYQQHPNIQQQNYQQLPPNYPQNLQHQQNHLQQQQQQNFQQQPNYQQQMLQNQQQQPNYQQPPNYQQQEPQQNYQPPPNYQQQQFQQQNEQQPIQQKQPQPQYQDQSQNQKIPPQYLAINDNGSKSEHETDLSDRGNKSEEDNSGKSTGSANSNLFATVGDIKKHSGSSEKSDDSTTSESRAFPPVALGGASMEFAVSRALGKYRQRQSSSVSDDQTATEDQVSIPEGISEYDEVAEIKDEQTKISPPEKPISAPIPIPLAPKNNGEEIKEKLIHNGSYKNDDIPQPPATENSPSAASLRSHVNRFLPRHQQSLEIPGRDDDDVRSTHSWRSTSRVSSRRQSTEDSIDSEDEWYCYELRKLEEMERQSQLEVDIEETVEEEPELEEQYTNEEKYEPDEEVKENMSFVLRELRMKAKVVEGVLDEEDNKKQILAAAKRRELQGTKQKSVERDNHNESFSLFAKVEYPTWKDSPSPTGDNLLKVEEIDDEHSHSSGETSGPDSPQHSDIEYDEAEIAEEDMEQSRRNSGRDGSFSVQSSISVPVSERWDEETATIKSGSTETATTATLPLPKIKIDNASCTSTVKEEIGKDAGPLGSKWKLLKALKERKAEEKSNQEKKEEGGTTAKEKVSYMAMMQKFYEIHVKT